MQLDEIARLSKHPVYPSVSLLASATDDLIPTLRQLAREARRRLELEYEPTTVDEFVARMDEQIELVEAQGSTRGIAVYASAVDQRWVPLPVTVRDRVVIDDTFATRDVVRALLRERRYRVLLLGSTAQLYSGIGPTLHRIQSGGFPVVVGDPASAAERPRRRERAESDRRRLQLATRAIDDALAQHLHRERMPLFVLGLQPRLGWFTRKSNHRASISATAVGAPTSAREIQALAAPLVEALFDQAANDAIASIGRARSRRRLATGIGELWPLARAGRGELLVVEQSYEFPAFLDLNPEHPRPAEDPTDPAAVDDLVDEAIETVLARSGRVVFVPDGSLSECDRIAMVLRY